MNIFYSFILIFGIIQHVFCQLNSVSKDIAEDRTWVIIIGVLVTVAVIIIIILLIRKCKKSPVVQKHLSYRINQFTIEVRLIIITQLFWLPVVLRCCFISNLHCRKYSSWRNKSYPAFCFRFIADLRCTWHLIIRGSTCRIKSWKMLLQKTHQRKTLQKIMEQIRFSFLIALYVR